MKRLEGKLCLVTAAGQGIGRASAERLAAEGGQVIATDINDAALAELDGIAGITAKKLDVTDGAAITALVGEIGQEIGPIDVLFNCAGIVHSGTILESSEADWDFAFELNVKAQFRLIRAVLPGMLETGKGSIINMSSVAGPVTGPVNRAAYSASKAAVAGMTRAVAQDYVTKGVRCNAIAPGTVDSPSLHERLRATGDYDGALKAFIARQPMGRIGAPDEIAALVAYLASDESSFTTGAIHIVDGGWTA